MKLAIIYGITLFGFQVFAADLIPEASNVAAMIASAQTCGTVSDCKTDLAQITKSLESRGFIILKTNNCVAFKTGSYSVCADGTRPQEVGSVTFAH